MGLNRINVVAGNFRKGTYNQYLRKFFRLAIPKKLLREKIHISQVESIEIASEQDIVSLGGAAGWGLAGAALLGPVGLLAGLILGGKGKDVTFICKFKDGRKFIGVTSSKTFNEIKQDKWGIE